MKTKDLFKKASETFAEYRKEFSIYCLVWIIIMGLALALSFVVQISFVLIFLLLFPIEFSLNFIAKKAGEHLPLDEKDFYFGFKSYPSSLIFGSKMNIKGLLMGFLWALISLLVGSLIIMLIFSQIEPALMNEIAGYANDVNRMVETIMAVKWVQELYLILYGVSGLVFMLAFAIKGTPANMAAYVCFDAPFDPDSGVKISKRIVDKNKKQYTLINIIFVFLIALAAVVGFSFYYLTYGSLFVNQYAVLLISSLLAAFILAPLNIYYQLVKFQFYDAYGKPEIALIIEELKIKREQAQQKMNEQQDNQEK